MSSNAILLCHLNSGVLNILKKIVTPFLTRIKLFVTTTMTIEGNLNYSKSIALYYFNSAKENVDQSGPD